MCNHNTLRRLANVNTDNCEPYIVWGVLSLLSAIILLIHHYQKHTELSGCYRCFQPEDVIVLCTHRRFSHEMFVAIFLIIAIVFFAFAANECEAVNI